MVTPEINHRRAVFVLGRIDEILSWEKSKEQEKDVRFVELGEYLCEVRTKQYWRLENLKSFDESLGRHFADSRRKAYYLMTIHEHLTRVPKPQLREMGWTKARELVKVARKDGGEFTCAPWVHKAKELPKEEFIRGGGATPDGEGNGGVGNHLLQALQEPVTRSGEGPRNCWLDARNRQVEGLLPGDDLR
jgi:hypothetical protein